MTVPSRRLRLEVLSSSGNGWGGAQLTLTAPSADGSADGSASSFAHVYIEANVAAMAAAADLDDAASLATRAGNPDT